MLGLNLNLSKTPKTNIVVPPPVVWTPQQLTTTLWLDASDSSKITTSGSTVTGIIDKSNSVRTLSVIGGLSLISSALNSLSVYRLNAGVSCGIRQVSSNIASSVPVLHSFAVVKLNSASASARTLFNASTDSGTGSLRSRLQLNTSLVPFTEGSRLSNGTSAGILNSTFGAINTSGYYLLGSYTNWSQNTQGIAVNAIYTTGAFGSGGANSPANLSSEICIGSFISGATNRWDGDIAEIIFINQSTTQENIDKIWGYLAHKWGISANLNISHPYKTTPPYI